MIKLKLNKFWFGMLIGMLGPFAGFSLFGLYYCTRFYVDFQYYVEKAFLGTKEYQSPIVTLSLLFNLLTFFIFLKLDWLRTAQGIVGATLVYAPFVIYLFFY